MNKKPLIIVLIIIILAMSFLIWFKNSKDINENLDSNIPVQDNSGDNNLSEPSGGIDINLSGDAPISTEKENSGEVTLSGDISNTSGEKEPVVVPENPPVNSTEKEPDTSNNQTDNENNIEEIPTSGETVNPVLASDDTKLAFKMGATQIVVYYYEGETITKKEAYIDYQTEAEAKKVATQYNDGTRSLSDIGNVKSATSQGKYVVMIFNEEEFEGLTVTKLRTMYKKYEITK